VVADTRRLALQTMGLLLALPSVLTAADLDRDALVGRDVIRLPVEEARGLTVHHLSTADGLSQAHVEQIIQDNLGFIWFGSQYGVNRYDGYKFKVFVHEPGDKTSAAGAYVTALFKDRAGMIWIGWGQGLDRLDPQTEVFTHYHVRLDESNELDDVIVHISQDPEGKLWLATGAGLVRLNPANGAVTRFRHGQEPDSLPTNDVNWSGQDSHGRFWVGTSEGLIEFDRTRGRVVRHIRIPEVLRISLFEDREGHFWITQASGQGLALFDPETNTVTPYSFYERDPVASALTGVMGIAEDAEGKLWVGSPGIGLLALNRERNRFFHYSYQPQDSHSLSENKVFSLLQDRDGNLWTGLDSAGVNYFGRGSQRFQVFRNIPGDPNSLTLDFVNAIFEDRDGILWIGNDDGLNRIDRKTGHREIIDLKLGVKPMVVSLAQDREGTIWAGTYQQGVTLYDTHTHRFETFRHDPSDPRSLSQNTVKRVHQDRKGTIWVATEDGLNRFDPVARSFTVYRWKSGSLNQVYNALAEDGAGNLWLGTQFSGVQRFDPTTGRFTVYQNPGDDAAGLRDSDANDILFSRNGTLWIGTQNGLNRLDPKTGAIRAYDSHDGMPANPVGCILEDDRGDLWLSTSRGISKYSPETGTFSNYTIFPGLRGSDFTGWDACSKGRRGELYFGGFSGAVAFVPTELEETAGPVPLVLTDFEVAGVPAHPGPDQPLERAIPYADKLTLTHVQRSFSITFAGLRYSSPETMRYRYRLEGLDTGTWHESPSSIRQATYTTLPPGTYSFLVQVATERGAWQAPGLTLRVLILPPWWATWWFRTACVLVLAALAWFAVRVRVRYVAREITVKMEARSEERMRIAQDLHDTLLQGLLSASLQLSVVQDQMAPTASARPLLEHVSSLLRQLVQEGRAAVRGLRTWHFDTDDLECAIAAIPGDLRLQSTAEFRVAIEGKSRPLKPAARTDVYLIAREAISNALRHSSASLIEVSLDYLADGFGLTIRDNGCGFVAEPISAGGTKHFGLMVMAERAERLGGILKVSSGPGVGTEIVLRAPARAIYQAEGTRKAAKDPV
jgi:ligand-binding sensor domain-containing protein/signal transduction histidine kinase